MSRHRVYVTPTAWKEIKALPGHVRQRVRRAINALADNQRPAGSKALAIPDLPIELRRLRFDRWRIIYAVTAADMIVDILAVRQRPPYDYGDLKELLRGYSP